MDQALSLTDKIKRGAEDSGRYFRYMADFVGFTADDAAAIRESRFIIEKYIPSLVSQFYAHLLSYPATRQLFLKPDGAVDRDYLQLRMHHLTNFWRRTASGVYDDDYARYVDYVGRAHTRHGADPNIYIAERYVIGQVAFMQRAVNEAITAELHFLDSDWEVRTLRAWNLLMMVILEMLARAYGEERQPETFSQQAQIAQDAVLQLAVEAYELGLGMRTAIQRRDVVVARADDIPLGERRIVEVEGISIGIFHHPSGWFALHNSCLHRGGPVCTGPLEGEVLTCPWHGYQYNLRDGRLLSDPSAALETYSVEVRQGEIHLQIPVVTRDEIEMTLIQELAAEGSPPLQPNEFLLSDLSPGKIALVEVDDEDVAVYNVNGSFYATQNACTHTEGPLDQGWLQGAIVTCPWHDSCFDVVSGEVRCGPAKEPLKTYRLVLDGLIGRVLPAEG